MRFIKKLSTCFCLLLAVSLGAQVSESFVITKVDSKELTNSFVTSIFQDERGYLWIGTIAGLNKYNGYEFIKYRSFQNDTNTLSNPAISCLFQLDASRLMVGTFNGLNIYNSVSNNFRRIKLDPSVPGYMKKMHISCIVENGSDEKLIGTEDGVLKYNEISNKLEPFKYGAHALLEGWNVQCLSFDHYGNLWAGVKKNVNGKLFSRVFKYEVSKNHLTEITPEVSSKGGHTGISEDYLGYIWVGVDEGLVRLDPVYYSQTYYKVPGNFNSNVTYLNTKDNMIWQSFWSFGITAFDIDTKQYKVIKNDPDNPKSLMSNKCWALCKDDNDILWIGTDVGVEKLTNRRPSLEVVKRKRQDAGNSFLSNRISAVRASRTHNNLVFAGIDGEGFSIYDRSTKKIQNFGPNVPGPNQNNERFVNHFFEDYNGDVYVAGQNNFQKISITPAGAKVKGYFKFQEHYSASIVQDPIVDDHLWIGGVGEVLLFNKRDESFTAFPEPGGVKNPFYSNFVFNRKVYLACYNGVLKIDPISQKMDFTPLNDVGNIMSALVINDTTVLLSSQYLGLIKFYPNTGKYSVVFKGKVDYFPEITTSVLYKNSVWMGSNHGLIKWNMVTREISEIKTHDGLPSETIHNLDIFGGYLYIATQEGLAIINPDQRVSHFNQPKTEITEISGILDSLSIKNISGGQEIILNEDQNSFKVSFTLLDFSLPEKNSFKYRLLPHEKEWQNLQSAHFIVFNTLPPGKYKFEVVGSNADQIWSAEPFSVTIRIVPPFYKTGWFLYLSVSLVILIIAIIVSFRIKSNIRKQALLERIIKERTAEIQEQRIELLDSINYAKRIQKAIFVGKDIFDQHLPQSFIYNQPKEQVSGDFYWIGKHKDLVIVFVGDCTGHGVPGAMLSIVATSLLNKIVYEQNTWMPGEILTRLNELFYNQLNLKAGSLRDGMDASVIALNVINKSAFFASAKNSAYYLGENNSLVELKGQRNSIGEEKNTEFSTTTMPYEPSRQFYLLTDGIKDQFGGPKQKRLSSKRLRQMLLNASHIPNSEQRKYFAQQINDWKNSNPQTDDMMLVGFRF